MEKRIRRIAPVQFGKVLAVVYALLSAVFVPIILIAALATPEGKGPGVLFALFMPVLYVIFGFIGGVIGSFLYNLAASWVGGIEIELED